MRIRDVLMVVIAIGGLIFAWLQEGSLHLQRGFVITISDSDVLIHNYVKPLVVDLYHEKKPVLLACPRADVLAVYPTFHARRNFEDVFVHMSPTKQVQVYSTIVGLGVGMTYEGSETQIALVTDDYRLEVFDRNLVSRWSSTVVPLVEAGIILHHAAVQVLPERIYEQDKGTIVVSVAVSGDNGTEHSLTVAFASDSGELRWRHVADEYHLGNRATANKNDGDDEESGEANNGKDKKNSTTAPGQADSRSVHRVVDGLLMAPEDLAERAHDLHWTHFRESVVAALPHVYRHSWDDHLQPQVFFHAKNRKKRSADRLHASTFESDGLGGSAKYKNRHVGLDKNDVGELGEVVGRYRDHGRMGPAAVTGKREAVPNFPRRHPNVLVHHGKDYMDVLHLYTGKRVTRVYPLKKHVEYHDLDDDFHIDTVSTVIGSHTSVHDRHGVDLVVDCLGAVHSGAPVAHDPVFNATICDTEGLLSGLNFVSGFLHGNQPAEQPQMDVLSLIGSRNVASSTTRAVTPLVVQHLIGTTGNRNQKLVRIQRHAVFLIDNGLMTCIDPVSKRVVWRCQTEATFPDARQQEAEEVSMGLHSDDEKEARLQKFPHLVRYAAHQSQEVAVLSTKLRYRETDPFVFAVGETHLAVVNARTGVLVETVALDQTPVAPTLVDDFNGDGVNDVVVFSANSIYGFVAHTQSATSTIAMLMILMGGMLVLLVVAREMREHDPEDEETLLPTTAGCGRSVRGASLPSGPRKLKRSTD